MKLKRFCTWNRPNNGRLPVNGVSWRAADVYCRHRGARLPTEAELEFALGAGARGKVYPWGDAPAPPKQFGNFADGSLPAGRKEGPRLAGYHDGFEGPAPVGNFAADALGLHDLSGNLWEWAADWFDEAGPPAQPGGPKSGTHKVLKGGNFYCVIEELRTSERHHKPAGDAAVFSGFRCARSARGGSR